MAEPLVRIVVHGKPAPGGSKDAFAIYKGTGPERYFTGRVGMQDAAKGGPAWRQAVVVAARQIIGCGCGEPGCAALAPGYPLDEPLTAAMVFTVSKPASASKSQRTWPSVRPDVLKYARSTEDALTSAGLWKDDARVVEYTRLAKVYPREDPDALSVPGAVIRIWRTHDLTGWQREAVASALQTGLFDPTQLTEGAVA